MKIKLPLFLLMCAVQLAVPGWTIMGHERVLTRGEEFRFGVMPLDPYDPFRGRYVWIDIDEPAAPYRGEETPRYKDKVYAYLDRDAEGMAIFTEIADEPPEDDRPYVRVEFMNPDPEGEGVLVQIPARRFYMEERIAPMAEEAYRQATRGNAPEFTLTMKVWRGRFVLTGMFVGDEPIAEYVKHPMQPVDRPVAQ